MARKIWLSAALFAAACGPGEQGLPWTPPAAIAGGWQLASSEAIPPEQAPEEVRRLGLETALRGRYDGPLPLTVEFYRMRSAPSAFELMQRWRPEPGRMASYKGRWFFLIQSDGAAHAELTAAAQGLEAALANRGAQ